MKVVCVIGTTSLLLCFPLAADEAVDYAKDVKPILATKCFACHGALRQESGLRLDASSLIEQGGDGGPVIVAGDWSASELFRRVATKDEQERMPPPGEGEALNAAQLALVKAWIEQGAVAPDEPIPADPRDHWAFRAPIRPEVLQVADNAWTKNEIDAFIAAKQQELRLKPVPQASKRLLLRRVYLDLIGLPPTRAQMRDFLNDPREDAYERIVDELLDSERYGERWGRHWMDVWRYTDWYGLGKQLRYSQKHIWNWRDWIIDSLNDDKGYDRMIQEMLAADEIAPTDRDALRATGFLARNYFLFNRTTWLDNTIEHTSKAFLGLTLNCCKCHDHKYDPLSQRDYYAMRAFFEPHQVRLDAVPGETDLEKAGLPRVFDAHPDAPTYLHIRGNAKDPDKSRVIGPSVPALLAFEDFNIQLIDLPPEAFNPALQPFVLENYVQIAEDDIAKAEATLSKARKQLAAKRAESAANQTAAKVDAGTAAEASAPSSVDAVEFAVTVAVKALAAAKLRPAALKTAHAADVAKHKSESKLHLDGPIKQAAVAARQYELAKAEEAVARAEQKLYSATEKEKKQAEMSLASTRANLQSAEKALATPGTKYTSLTASLKALEGPDESDASRRKPYPQISTGRRTALARWIAHRKNPLTARVAANHIWLRHFGRPLVEPVTDFGRRAAPPRHPQLLDWLAVEFMESGWSMKHVHRLMVTSQTYRLDASTALADEQTQKKDPENHFYWRRNSIRMQSQVVRDSLLQLAGVLDPTIGGPTIDPNQGDTAYRRSLYFTRSRDQHHKFISMFDDADILQCYRRSESIVPQQALTLANSKLALSMARKIEERLRDGEMGSEGDRQFAQVAFELLICRVPDAEELNACMEALEDTRQELKVKGDSNIDSRARANLIHALLNHNDFITVR